jgi:hypothetical protein
MSGLARPRNRDSLTWREKQGERNRDSLTCVLFVSDEQSQRRMGAASLGLVSNLDKFQELTSPAGNKDESAVRLFLR